MNKHIELVNRWLADFDSVSIRELNTNYEASKNACTIYDATNAAAHAATNAAAHAATNAAAHAASYSIVGAAWWVGRYEELTQQQGD